MIEREGKGEECGEHSKVVSTGEFWKCLPAWGYLNPLNPPYIAIFHTGSGPTLGWLGLTYVSQLCPFPLLAQDCPYLLLQFCLSKQLWSQPPTLCGHPISKDLSPFEISTAVAMCPAIPEHFAFQHSRLCAQRLCARLEDRLSHCGSCGAVELSTW